MKTGCSSVGLQSPHSSHYTILLNLFPFSLEPPFKTLTQKKNKYKLSQQALPQRLIFVTYFSDAGRYRDTWTCHWPWLPFSCKELHILPCCGKTEPGFRLEWCASTHANITTTSGISRNVPSLLRHNCILLRRHRNNPFPAVLCSIVETLETTQMSTKNRTIKLDYSPAIRNDLE